MIEFIVITKASKLEILSVRSTVRLYDMTAIAVQYVLCKLLGSR